MASNHDFVDFVIDKIQSTEKISSRKMFGEYGLFAGKKIFGLICDNKLFIKPTISGKEYIGNVVEAPPYPGAKPSFLIEENIEDSEWLSNLVRITVEELPEPKPKRSKEKK